MSDKPHGNDNPLMQLWVAMSGASTGHHEETPGVEPQSVAVGHEPDRFGIAGIVAVPVAVLITLVVTYVVVTLLMRYVSHGSSDPIASKDPLLNDRLGRIDSGGGKAAKGVLNSPSGEPRLDGLPRLDTRVNGKDVAPFLLSFRPTPTGNSAPIYPEDLRPENYTDPETQQKPLADWPSLLPVKEEKKEKLARLPVTTAVHLLGSEHAKRQAEVRRLLSEVAEQKEKLKKAQSEEEKKKVGQDIETLENKVKAITGSPEYQYFEVYAPVSTTPISQHVKPTDRVKASNGGAKVPLVKEPVKETGDHAGHGHKH